MENIPKVGDYLVFTNGGGAIFGIKIPLNTPIKLIEIEYEHDNDVNGIFENGNTIRLHSSGYQKGYYEKYYTIQSQELIYEIY